MAFVVDALTPADLEGALRLSTQAGWNQVPSDWRRVLDLSPTGCLAGRLDGALVATATVASAGPGVQWIGLVLVDEALRGRGYGGTMLSRVLEIARARASGVIGLDASDLGRPVYLKQGFADVCPIDRWEGRLRPPGDPGDAFPATRAEFDAIADFDRAACGTDRRELLLHLLNDPAVFGAVAVERNGIAGYAFLAPGRTHAHLGPIVAAGDQETLNLLARLAPLAEGKPIFVDSIRTPVNSALLERCGLRVVRRLTRMTLGGATPVLMGDRVRAAVSFTWG